MFTLATEEKEENSTAPGYSEMRNREPKNQSECLHASFCHTVMYMIQFQDKDRKL